MWMKSLKMALGILIQFQGIFPKKIIWNEGKTWCIKKKKNHCVICKAGNFEINNYHREIIKYHSLLSPSTILNSYMMDLLTLSTMFFNLFNILDISFFHCYILYHFFRSAFQVMYSPLGCSESLKSLLNEWISDSLHSHPWKRILWLSLLYT